MRYYDLSLLNAAGQLLASTNAGFVPSTTGQPTFSSRVRQQNGQLINNPGALNIEFDVSTVGFALPQGGAWIRVSGIGLRTIGQASNLNADPVTGRPAAKFILSAGWTRGLPLANDYVNRNLSGIIAQGQILNAYGQWQGAEQSLDLNLIAAIVNPPGGLSFVWQPGQEIGAAIQSCLAIAFQTLSKPKITVLQGLVQRQSSQNVVGWYESLAQFAAYILDQSKALGAASSGNKRYPGIIIGIQGNTPFATDATQNPPVVPIAFQDLVGQPTWILPNTINFKCVMRADIQVGSMVTMPPDPGTGGTTIISSLALTQQGANYPGAPARNSSAFKGSFVITEVHHFANFRQPDGDSWATAFQAVQAA